MGLSVRRHHTIRSLEVTGAGFLGGLDLRFSRGLNCLIGGRGAGKTTVLEFLRYALDELPQDERGRARRQAVERLVEGNLNGGRIRVGIETADGLVYHVERSAGEPRAEVLDAEDRPTALTLGRGGLFGAEVYSQNEIERIADTPGFQLGLIDGFREDEVADLDRALRRLEIGLRTNARELVGLSGQLEELDAALAELPLVTERLRQAIAEGQAAPPSLERELELKAQRDDEQRAVRRCRELLAARRAPLAALVRDLARDDEQLHRTGACAGPNAALLERVVGCVTDHRRALAEALEASLDRVARAGGELDAFAGELELAHREQERSFQLQLQAHHSEREQAQRRLELQRRHAELQEQARERDGRRDALARARERRRELLAELVELRTRRTALRQEVVDYLNARLAPEIRVSLDPGRDRAAYRQLLCDAFQGVGRPYRGAAEGVAKALRPDVLVELVRCDDREQLGQRSGLTASQVDWVVERLRQGSTLLELEAIELGDVPRIELLDGDYKDAPRLSTGQKCTTILPILLLEGEKPLLIDEPEGNLDNAFVYSTIVKKIRAVKPSRQLIFVTHNPNIPVLGDAEQVVVLGSSGRRAEVLAEGGIDAAKDHVERILEGGREAFEERRRRYGH
ncbi:MAG: AAA family ATPase [Planctomycetota bacterium]